MRSKKKLSKLTHIHLIYVNLVRIFLCVIRFTWLGCAMETIWERLALSMIDYIIWCMIASCVCLCLFTIANLYLLCLQKQNFIPFVGSLESFSACYRSLRINSVIFTCNRHAERLKFIVVFLVDCRHWMIFIAHQRQPPFIVWVIALLAVHFSNGNFAFGDTMRDAMWCDTKRNRMQILFQKFYGMKEKKPNLHKNLLNIVPQHSKQIYSTGLRLIIPQIQLHDISVTAVRLLIEWQKLCTFTNRSHRKVFNWNLSQPRLI